MNKPEIIKNKFVNGPYSTASSIIKFNNTYYLVDTAITPDRGYETMAFKCDGSGKVLDFGEVAVDYTLSHEDFIDNFGELLCGEE